PVQGGEIRPVPEQDVPGVEVAVDLPQAVRAGFQLPPPVDETAFDVPEKLRRDASGRIAVHDSQDAFAVSDELADAPHVQSRLGPPDAVDLQQVVAQRIRSRQVESRGRAAVPEAGEVDRIAL